MGKVRIDTISLKQLDSKLKGELNEVLNNSDHATPFHSLDLSQFVSDYFLLDSYLIYASMGDEIRGFLIFHKDKKNNTLASPYQLSLTVYGGPVSLPGNELVIISLLRYLKKSAFRSRVYIKSGPAVSFDLFSGAGYKVKTIPTLLIDTCKSEKELWEGLENRIRRNIRKAKENNIEITILNNNCIDRFIELYRELCLRKDLFFHGADYYRNLYGILQKDVKMRIFYAAYEGEVISAMSVLEYKDYINPWFGGTDHEYLSTGAGSLLYWEIIRYASCEGYRIYDFLGLDVGPIAFYKKGFGGREADVCHASYSPLYLRGYNKLFKLFKR